MKKYKKLQEWIRKNEKIQNHPETNKEMNKYKNIPIWIKMNEKNTKHPENNKIEWKNRKEIQKWIKMY